MKTLSTIVSLIFLYSFLCISTAEAQRNIDRSDLLDYTGGSVITTPPSTQINGSPFLNDDWLKGKVLISNNVESEDVLLRFDIHENVVQFRRGGEIFGLNSNKISGFRIYATPNDIVFKNGFRSDEHEIDKAILLRIIEDGDAAKFVAHHKSTLHEDVPTYGSATTINEYRSNETYYLIDENGDFEEVKLRKRHITRVLSDMDNQIEDYADENNLSFRDENDVAQIVSKYNELKSDDGNS